MVLGRQQNFQPCPVRVGGRAGLDPSWYGAVNQDWENLLIGQAQKLANSIPFK